MNFHKHLLVMFLCVVVHIFCLHFIDELSKFRPWYHLFTDEGVEWADLMVDKAEVEVVGTTDPEKLCCLLREVTKKHVKIRTENTVSEAGSATSQQTKGLLVGQVSRDWTYWQFQSNKPFFIRRIRDTNISPLIDSNVIVQSMTAISELDSISGSFIGTHFLWRAQVE